MQKSPRITIVAISFLIFSLLLVARLFYWQIISSKDLSVLAASQRESVSRLLPNRGNILASDGFPLAINKEGFLLYANPQKLSVSPKLIADSINPILSPKLDQIKVATDSSKEEIEDILEKYQNNNYERIYSQLSREDLVWVLLDNKITKDQKDKIDAFGFEGLGYQKEPIRSYPEASMAAHVLGFMASNDQGEKVGYFGLEGYYDLELSGRSGIIKQEKDAVNRPIPIGKFWNQQKRDGRDLVTYIDRSIQFFVEKKLKTAVEKYKAKSGIVVIMDPSTGGIIAMASYPNYDPRYYTKYDQSLYLNPVVSMAYEPGSTFKVLTVSAGINEGKIKPDTKCDICDGPYRIDKYYIRTWNDKYHKDTNMTEALAHSDNVAMVFIAKKLGIDIFTKYLSNFGIGKNTDIDLQGEVSPVLRKNWKEVDLYTASFGQGLLVTPIQMITAVNSIANHGNLMQPMLVKTIIDDDRKINIQPNIINHVVSKETADIVTEMMVAAVEYGDAKWARLDNYKIAGKTGTAQVAINGKYDESKTIASFVGFAPAYDPKFTMLTVINQPETSEWGSETAAPLFFDIAEKLFIMLGIDKQNNS